MKPWHAFLLQDLSIDGNGNAEELAFLAVLLFDPPLLPAYGIFEHFTVRIDVTVELFILRHTRKQALRGKRASEIATMLFLSSVF